MDRELGQGGQGVQPPTTLQRERVVLGVGEGGGLSAQGPREVGGGVLPPPYAPLVNPSLYSPPLPVSVRPPLLFSEGSIYPPVSGPWLPPSSYPPDPWCSLCYTKPPTISGFQWPPLLFPSLSLFSSLSLSLSLYFFTAFTTISVKNILRWLHDIFFQPLSLFFFWQFNLTSNAREVNMLTREMFSGGMYSLFTRLCCQRNPIPALKLPPDPAS